MHSESRLHCHFPPIKAVCVCLKLHGFMNLFQSQSLFCPQEKKFLSVIKMEGHVFPLPVCEGCASKNTEGSWGGGQIHVLIFEAINIENVSSFQIRPTQVWCPIRNCLKQPVGRASSASLTICFRCRRCFRSSWFLCSCRPSLCIKDSMEKVNELITGCIKVFLIFHPGDLF